MSVDLVFLRHGPAGEADPRRWPDDRDRPLTEEGAARVTAAIATLRELGVVPTAVVTSPAARAAATARRVVDAFSLPAAIEWPELLPEAPLDRAQTRLRTTLNAPECLGTLVVAGHEPLLTELAGWLIARGAPASLKLDKAGLIGLRLRSGGPAELRFLIPKRLLG